MAGSCGVLAGLLTFLLLGFMALVQDRRHRRGEPQPAVCARRMSAWRSYAALLAVPMAATLIVPDDVKIHADAHAARRVVRCLASARSLQCCLLYQSVAVSCSRLGFLSSPRASGRSEHLKLWARLRSGCCVSLPESAWRYEAVSTFPQALLSIAGKHQSTWETFALLPLFEDPAMVLKSELRVHSLVWLVHPQVQDDPGGTTARARPLSNA